MSRPTPAQAVQTAVAALAGGGMVIVVDDADRENEGDLVVVAAETCTAGQMAFIVRHTTGIVCTPMPAERAEILQLPQMVSANSDSHGTAFTVTVDHFDTSTGVSAARPGVHRARPGLARGDRR